MTKPPAKHWSQEYLRRDEVAEYLGIPISTLRDLQKQKKIPFYRLSPRLVLFKRSEVEKALERFKIRAVGE